MTQPPPQDRPVKVHFCQECGRPILVVKCEHCVVNDLPKELVRFGQAVKAEQPTGEP